MNQGTWLKPPGQRIQHFILKPRDEDLAMRHAACGRVFLFGTGKYKSSARYCGECDRRRSAHQEGEGR